MGGGSTFRRSIRALEGVEGHIAPLSWLSGVAAGLFEFRLFVSPVGTFAGGFLSWLRNVSGILGEVLAMFVLHLDDFFIVGDVSWIGHQPL